MKYICDKCHVATDGKRQMDGSMLMEFILWCVFIIPGIIYSMWRHTTVKKGCHECGSKELIPVNSPKAKKILGVA